MPRFSSARALSSNLIRDFETASMQTRENRSCFYVVLPYQNTHFREWISVREIDTKNANGVNDEFALFQNALFGNGFTRFSLI
jgi:hypothetical protein